MLDVFDTYGEALGDTALATVAGEPLEPETATGDHATLAEAELATISCLVGTHR